MRSAFLSKVLQWAMREAWETALKERTDDGFGTEIVEITPLQISPSD